MDDANAIEVRALTKRFGSFTAVDSVSFHVEKGEIFGYLGANGAGKSTTIRMLCGLMAPTAGDATVAGHSIATAPTEVKRRIGYMSQRFSLYLDLTVQENLEFFAGAYSLSGQQRREAMRSAIDRSGLHGHERSLTRGLPGGIRQRLALATALIHSPAIVFLDEPTAGVAPDARRDFWREIRRLSRLGTTIFVTTHHLDEAEYCHRVGLMVDGRLSVLDTPQALKRTWAPGHTYAVPTSDAAADGRALAAHPQVAAVQPFGQTLHVRLREGATADMAGILADVGSAPRECESVEATLEDVFLEVVKREQGKESAA